MKIRLRSPNEIFCYFSVNPDLYLGILPSDSCSKPVLFYGSEAWVINKRCTKIRGGTDEIFKTVIRLYKIRSPKKLRYSSKIRSG
jgi:hypothetical protein